MVKKGIFIVIEGIDGSGKSTQIDIMKHDPFFSDFEFDCEPTKDGAIGQYVRKLVSSKVEVKDETIALLFAADRCEHTKKIISRLNEGINIVCDRYVLSSMAYQISSGVNPNLLFLLKEEVSIEPDLTIYIDLTEKEAMKRIERNREQTTYYENLTKLHKIRSAYLWFCECYGYAIVDGSKSIKSVSNDIRNMIENFLHNRENFLKKGD